MAGVTRALDGWMDIYLIVHRAGFDPPWPKAEEVMNLGMGGASKTGCQNGLTRRKVEDYI